MRCEKCDLEVYPTDGLCPKCGQPVNPETQSTVSVVPSLPVSDNTSKLLGLLFCAFAAVLFVSAQVMNKFQLFGSVDALPITIIGGMPLLTVLVAAGVRDLMMQKASRLGGSASSYLTYLGAAKITLALSLVVGTVSSVIMAYVLVPETLIMDESLTQTIQIVMFLNYLTQGLTVLSGIIFVAAAVKANRAGLRIGLYKVYGILQPVFVIMVFLSSVIISSIPYGDTYITAAMVSNIVLGVSGLVVRLLLGISMTQSPKAVDVKLAA